METVLHQLEKVAEAELFGRGRDVKDAQQL